MAETSPQMERTTPSFAARSFVLLKKPKWFRGYWKDSGHSRLTHREARSCFRAMRDWNAKWIIGCIGFHHGLRAPACPENKGYWRSLILLCRCNSSPFSDPIAPLAASLSRLQDRTQKPLLRCTKRVGAKVPWGGTFFCEALFAETPCRHSTR